METLQPFHFDLAVHPTKDTIKLITSLLEKVIKVNETLHPNNKPSHHNNSAISESNKDNATNEQQQQPVDSNSSNTNSNNNQIHRSTSSSSSTSSRRSSTTNIYTCFYARSIPGISIQAYLTRILKYCPCANECFLAILVYFDRMSKPALPSRPVPLKIDSFNIHRLIIAGVMIASKLFSDVFFTNTRYAKVGGLPVSELNVLELEFLALNNYNLFVTVEEFQYYGDQLLLHWMKEHEGNVDKPMLYTNEISNQNDITKSDTTQHHHHHHHRNNYNPSTMKVESLNSNQPITKNSTDFNTSHINNAAQNLTINKNSLSNDTTMTDYDSTTNNSPKTTTSMKDLSRKSDEIDQHRLFKRPSSRIFDQHSNSLNTDNTTIHSSNSIPIQSDNSNNKYDNNSSYDNNNFKSQTTQSSTDRSVLPTPPCASPSTVPTTEKSSN